MTPVLLDLRRVEDDLEIHIHTAHGWTVAGQLTKTFEAEDVRLRSTMGFATTVTHTVVTVAEAVGGVGGVAAALNVFFQRHKHRKITVKVGKREISVQGFSVEDTERLLVEALGAITDESDNGDEQA